MPTTYATLTDVKAALRITDSVDDTLLTSLITTASRRIDNRCGRRFYADAAATARTYTAQQTDTVMTDDISTTTSLVVKVDDDGDGTFETTLTVGTDYQLEPLNALARSLPINLLRGTGRGFPRSSVGQALVEVTAKWGWPSVPEPIAEATRLLVMRQFRRFDSPLGVAGFGDLGAIMVRNLDPDIEALIGPYTVVTVA